MPNMAEGGVENEAGVVKEEAGVAKEEDGEEKEEVGVAKEEDGDGTEEDGEGREKSISIYTLGSDVRNFLSEQEENAVQVSIRNEQRDLHHIQSL